MTLVDWKTGIDENTCLNVAENAALLLSLFFIAICFLLSIIMFPIYLYVYRDNRDHNHDTFHFDHDQKNIRPIVTHLHWIVKLTLTSFFAFVVFCVIVNTLLVIFNGTLPEGSSAPFLAPLVGLTVMSFIVFTALCLSIQIAFQQVLCLLHFLLALQRFLLYFYPETEKYVNLTEKSMMRAIKVLYGTCLSISAAIFLYWWFQDGRDIFVEHILPKRFYTSFFTFISFLTFFLLISVVFRSQKVSKSSEKRVQKPELENYVFYQAILLLIVRIPLFILVTLAYIHVDERFLLIPFMILLTFCDTFLTPFTVETAYLYANRGSTRGLLSRVPVFGFFCRKTRAAHVQPSFNGP